jgi:pilus assembly protein CpaE
MIAAVISKDAALRTRLGAAFEEAVDIDSVLMFPDYPGASDIRSLELTGEKYVAFIDFRDDTGRALALAGEINRSCPSVGAVALNVGTSQADLIAIVHAGICEVLPHEFSNRDVATAVLNVTRKLAGTAGPAGDGVVYAFLPAKPGSGASSLAVYSAIACARHSERRPLLLDFDIHRGITSFVLKLDSANSIVDALENAGRMDQTLWAQLLSQRDNLDILGSAPGEPGVTMPLERFQSILKWGRRQNGVLVVDLPGTMEDFEIATLQQAGTIFLVCTPDLVSLHVARQTIQRLHSLNLLDRIAVLLNRVDKRTGLSIRDIEGILSLPVRFTIPADERSIREAVEQGTGVNPKSVFGTQIEAIARKLVGNVQNGPNPAPAGPKKRFVEFFAIPHSRTIDPGRRQ